MKKRLPKVSIIVVNYNGKQFLKDCFDSLLALRYPGERPEVIMVDNASHDGSLRFVKKHYPRIKIIASKDNNYCRSLNQGIRASSADYVVTLNNDTRVDARWLTELMKVALSDKKIAGVGSKILFLDGRIHSVAHKALPNYYWSDLGFQEVERGQFNTIAEVESICGASSLYRKAYLEEVGLFDEDFEMYIEDVDMNMRLRNKGYKIYYAPKSVVYHKYHGTAEDGFTVFHVERNRLLFIAKHYPERLGEALMGSGYFTVPDNLDRERDIYNVLPLVLVKLYRHHRSDFARYFPDLCTSLKKIANVEKNKLIQFVEGEREKLMHSQEEFSALQEASRQQETLLQEKASELSQRLKELSEKDALLIGKDALLEEKDNELKKMYEELQGKLAELQQEDALLTQKETLIAEKDGQLIQFVAQLRQRLEELPDKDSLLQEKENQLRQLSEQLHLKLGELQQLGVALETLKQKDTTLKEQEAQLGVIKEQLQLKLGELQHKDALLEQKDLLVTEKERQVAQVLEQLQLRLKEAQDKDSSLISKDSLLQEKDHQLVQLSERMEISQAAIQEKEGLLNQRDLLLAEKDKQLAQALEQLRVRSEELKDRDAALAHRDSLLHEKTIQLVRMNEQLQLKLGELQHKDALLEQKDLLVDEKGQQLRQVQEELKKAASALHERDVSLQEKELQLRKVIGQLQKKTEAIVGLGRDLDAKSLLLAQQSSMRQKNEEALMQLSGKLEEKEREAQEQSQIIAQDKERVAQLQGKLQEQLKQLTDTQSQLQQKDDQLETKEAALNHLAAELQDKDIELKTRGGEIETLRGQIDAFYNSETFLFVVRPLWRFLEFIKGFKKRLFTPIGLLKISLPRTKLTSPPTGVKTGGFLKRDKAMKRRKKTVCLSSFLTNVNKAYYRGNNQYFLKITNVSETPERARVMIDILSDTGKPQNLYASFGKAVDLKPRFSTELKIEYDWTDKVFLYNDGDSFSPDNIAVNTDEPQEGYFTLRALLLDSSGSSRDTLEIHQLLVK